MRHVVVLNQFALPRTQAGGTRHVDLFGRINGWEPTIVAGNRNHYTQKTFETSDARFKLVTIPSQDGGAADRVRGWIVYSIRAFWFVVTRHSVDVVYGSTPHLLAPLAGLAAARIRRVPFVLEVRDLWPESIVDAGKVKRGGVLHGALTALERHLVRAAHRVVVVSEGWDEHFVQLGVDLSKIVVVPNGTELNEFETSRPRVELRADLELSGFTAVFAGAHGPKDGIDLILDAAELLPDVEFLLIGAGPAKRDAELRASECSLQNIRFLDPIPKAQLADVLRACDVGVHAVSPLAIFDKGMSPNKLFDYMASELPVVSNAEAALRHVIRDGECGRLGGTSSLAAGIRDVMDATAEQRAAWGETGAEIVARRFSREAGAAKIGRMLTSAVERDLK